jgi:hypothetical protein
MGCTCHGCAHHQAALRPEKAIRQARRLLLVAAAMVLIPFIMVVSMAQAKGVRR